MARILLVDDDGALLDALSMAFEDAGHSVRAVADGRQGLAAVADWAPDAVVSDVNMPVLDGFSLCRQLRSDGNPVPVVLLTARDSEIDEALGLEMGADDYVSTPVSTRVLLARIAALLRRDALRRGGQAAQVRRIGALSLDADRLEARWDGVALVTTVTEFRLLQALTERPGVVRSRDQLLQSAREDDSVVAVRIIDTYIRRLRRKLEAIDPDFDGIETMIGAGYRWRSP